MSAPQNWFLARSLLGIEAKIPRSKRGAHRRLVSAGLKRLSAAVNDRCGPGPGLPNAVAELVSELPILYVQPENKTPVPNGTLAGFALMLKVLDLIERESGELVTAAVIGAATQATAEAMLGKMGVTVAQIEQAAAQVCAKERFQ